MQSCDFCNLTLEADANYCPRCGRKLVHTDSPHRKKGRSSSQIQSLLTEARTLKLRSELEQAVEKCLDALKLDPDNADTYAVLGEIYESQGKVEQAIQWYQMADVEYAGVGISTQDLKARIRCLESCRCATVGNPNWYDRIVADTKFSSTLRIITAALFGFLVILILGALFVIYADRTKDKNLPPPHTLLPQPPARVLVLAVTPQAQTETLILALPESFQPAGQGSSQGQRPQQPI